MAKPTKERKYAPTPQFASNLSLWLKLSSLDLR